MGKAPKPGEPVPDLLPERPSLKSLRDVAAGCKACDLYKRGTQTVFGEGPRRAEDPSSILRAPGDDARHEEMRRFVADLKKVAGALK